MTHHYDSSQHKAYLRIRPLGYQVGVRCVQIIHLWNVFDSVRALG